MMAGLSELDVVIEIPHLICAHREARKAKGLLFCGDVIPFAAKRTLPTTPTSFHE